MGTDDSAEKPQQSYSLAKLAEELGKTFHGQRLFKGALRSRERYIHALFEIVSYLTVNGVHPIICLEINELILGLIELDRGAVRHFLKPKPAGSKPADADDLWRARAYLAIAVDLIFAAGSSQREAARQVASATANIAGLVSKPTRRGLASAKCYEDVLAKWHSAFKNQKVKSSGALLVFNDRERVASIYREKIKSKDVAQEKTEGLVINSFLRDAVYAAVRAADSTQLAAMHGSAKKGRMIDRRR